MSAGVAPLRLRSPMLARDGHARRMDDRGLDPRAAQPAGQPEAVPAGLEGNSDTPDCSPGPGRLIPPPLAAAGEAVLVRLELLQRVTLEARHNPGDEPARLAQLDHHDERALLLESKAETCVSYSAAALGRSVVASGDDGAPFSPAAPYHLNQPKSATCSRTSGRPRLTAAVLPHTVRPRLSHSQPTLCCWCMTTNRGDKGCPNDARGCFGRSVTPLVFAVVLGAAVLHATWNALVKHGGDPFLRLARRRPDWLGGVPPVPDHRRPARSRSLAVAPHLGRHPRCVLLVPLPELPAGRPEPSLPGGPWGGAAHRGAPGLAGRRRGAELGAGHWLWS